MRTVCQELRYYQSLNVLQRGAEIMNGSAPEVWPYIVR
jgi:hypothetical protein